MAEGPTCSECHCPIPSNAVGRYCPQCLLSLGLGDTEPDHSRPSSPETLSPSQRMMGDYELLEQIGAGGMGVVFKARHRTLNRIDALKMIRSGSLASAAELKRFRTEAQAAARLQHPNVVAIHQVGEEAGQVFFSMDYIEGKSLAELIKSKPLPPVRAAEYVKTITEAVQYAHERGVLHRDLKPANVLIDGSDQPRITDFGLARQVEFDSDLSRSGDALGTPGYMPPEQAAGRRNEIGPASDVYALGALLYDLLTGRPPFRADTAVETLRQVLETEPAPPRLLNRSVPLDLDTICLKCLNKEPSRRYASAGELAEELKCFLKNEPIKARPIGPAERTWRWCRRHPALAGFVTAIISLMILVSISALSVARVLEEELREEVLKANVYAAQGIAGIVLWQLDRLSGPLVQTAQDEPGLRAALQSEDDVRLQEIAQEIFHKFDKPANQFAVHDRSPFKSWYVLNSRGVLVGLWPMNKNIMLEDFSYRDYFQGANRIGTNRTGRDAIHLSRVFQARNDDLYKCAISTPIYAGDKFLGVLASTISLSPRLGPDRLNDERRKAVLIGPLEVPWPAGATSAPVAASYTLFVHEAITEATNAFKVEKAQLRAVPTHVLPGSIFQLRPPPPTEASMNPAYQDPMGRTNSVYAGRWLAGFAPVGNTEWVVNVQQRYAESIQPVKATLFRLGLWGGSALALLILVISAAAWLKFFQASRA